MFPRAYIIPVYDLNDIHCFVSSCREIVGQGKLVSRKLGGGLKFDDGGIQIHEKEDGSMAITYHLCDSKGNSLGSKRVIYVESNDFISSHDESWIHGIERVDELFTAKPGEKPTRGKITKGSTGGFDLPNN
jgi:hypothetical protein